MDESKRVDELVGYIIERVVWTFLCVDGLEQAYRAQGLSLEDNPDYRRLKREYIEEVAQIIADTMEKIQAASPSEEGSEGVDPS